jgi:hypothetical protein
MKNNLRTQIRTTHFNLMSHMRAQILLSCTLSLFPKVEARYNGIRDNHSRYKNLNTMQDKVFYFLERMRDNFKINSALPMARF